MSDKPTCQTCRFLDRASHSQCRRHAPVRVDRSGHVETAQWPTVSKWLDWCGDHQPAPQETETPTT